jgi:hypothetical protein
MSCIITKHMYLWLCMYSLVVSLGEGGGGILICVFRLYICLSVRPSVHHILVSDIISENNYGRNFGMHVPYHKIQVNSYMVNLDLLSRSPEVIGLLLLSGWDLSGWDLNTGYTSSLYMVDLDLPSRSLEVIDLILVSISSEIFWHKIVLTCRTTSKLKPFTKLKL